MCHMASVWTVTVVTLHRYIAVCFPHRVQQLASLRVARLQASFPLYHCDTMSALFFKI